MNRGQPKLAPLIPVPETRELSFLPAEFFHPGGEQGLSLVPIDRPEPSLSNDMRRGFIAGYF